MRDNLNKCLWIGIGFTAILLFFIDVPVANLDLLKQIVAAAIGAATGSAVTYAVTKGE
jgi:hypothetical protein